MAGVRRMRRMRARYPSFAAAKVAGGSFVQKSVRTPEQVFENLSDKLDRIAAGHRRREAARAELWLAEGKIP